MATILQLSRLQALRQALLTERQSFDSHWQDIANFLMPRRTRFYASDRNRGDRRNQNIIDNTARMSIRTLQSGLHAGLTSPARPWFRLGVPDPELADYPKVKAWLAELTERMQRFFAGTNLYNSLPTVYGDMGTFGTSACYIANDDEDLFRSYPFAVGSYALGLDARGLVSTFTRDYQRTVEQVVEDYAWAGPGRPKDDVDWSKVSHRTRQLWEDGNYQAAVDLTWLVMPNPAWDDRKLLSQFKRYLSTVWESGAQQGTGGDVLEEKGYDTFPVLCPRWDVADGDVYGTSCPGMDALGDVKQLQIEQREKGRAIKKMIDPPLVASHDMKASKVSILPGDVNYAKNLRDGGLRAAHEVRFDISAITGDIREVQYRIDNAFYGPLFQMMRAWDLQNDSSARPTATEVNERREEKLLALGPVLERTSDELLNPLIERAFQRMKDRGVLPQPIPDEIQGMRLRVEYISIMAAAQKAVGMTALERFIGTVIPFSEQFPEAKAKLKPLAIVEEIRSALGVNPKLLHTDEEAEAQVQADRQATQQAAQAEQMAQYAKAARDASAQPIAPGSPLEAALGGGLAATPTATIQ